MIGESQLKLATDHDYGIRMNRGLLRLERMAGVTIIIFTVSFTTLSVSE